MGIYDKDKKAKQSILHSIERISYFCYLLFELKGVKNYVNETIMSSLRSQNERKSTHDSFITTKNKTF
jgi:hypothetical protein